MISSNEHGNVKECDGTHSERSARGVPTPRNKRKHRIGATTEESSERKVRENRHRYDIFILLSAAFT